jgi:hypothetical protein
MIERIAMASAMNSHYFDNPISSRLPPDAI